VRGTGYEARGTTGYEAQCRTGERLPAMARGQGLCVVTLVLVAVALQHQHQAMRKCGQPWVAFHNSVQRLGTMTVLRWHGCAVWHVKPEVLLNSFHVMSCRLQLLGRNVDRQQSNCPVGLAEQLYSHFCNGCTGTVLVPEWYLHYATDSS
jgi:hypothetical protein